MLFFKTQPAHAGPTVRFHDTTARRLMAGELPTRVRLGGGQAKAPSARDQKENNHRPKGLANGPGLDNSCGPGFPRDE